MNKLISILSILVFLVACGDDSIVDEGRDLTHVSYDPVPFTVEIPDSFPILEIPEDNLLTVAGVDLGRRLFYDPILSADSTMSCFSCHEQQLSFTDQKPFSVGIDGIEGSRSSMSLLNVGFFYTGLFWDGRAGNLEDQAILPIEDPVELHARWPDIEERLRAHTLYPELFRESFGINNTNEITRELAVKAIAQFERTLISSGSSKYDRVIRGKDLFSQEEQMGFEIFFDLNDELPDGECFHCHNAPLFTTNEYLNNGLDAVQDLDGFADKGRGAVTGLRIDNGKFRVPTLRNISFTAPYMHDGRFETLEEVIEHYNSGGHPSPNKDPLMVPLGLTQEQQDAVLAFLLTLNDEDFNTNPSFSNPH